MTPTLEMKSSTVAYFAVYPDGRRVSVTAEAIEKYGDDWANEPDERFRVTLETEVTETTVPIFGDVKYF